MSDTLLRVEDLRIIYKTDMETVYAVNGISFSLCRGKTLGLVGETGAGKTTTALSLLRLLPDRIGIITSGSITFDGQNLLTLPIAEMRQIRGKRISMIFQDPMTSLNPVLTVGDQIAEALILHSHTRKKDAHIGQKVDEVLSMVGIPPSRKNEYPHQFSGGMKQRVVIAIALACNPGLLIADEPTTALDVTIQAQILDLMVNLKKEYNTAMILITHDLGVVAEICDKVAIIYAGQIMESGAIKDIYEDMKHPYSRGLFDSLPDIQGEPERLKVIEGVMPDPANLPAGCKFHPRCPHKTDECVRGEPELLEVSPGHRVRCILYR